MSSNKKRPVLVISNNDYNTNTNDIIVAAITSNIERKKYSIIFTNDDMVDGSLKTKSCVRADKIYTLSKTIIVKRFGRINNHVIEKVKKEITGWMRAYARLAVSDRLL